jgi:multidrug efflux pump
VQFRVSGDDPDRLREIARRVRDEMRADPDLADVHLDWGELAPSVRLEVDPVKARALGIDRNELSRAVAMLLDGVAVTELREGGETIDVVLRATEEERRDLSGLGTLSVGTADGTVLPLGQVAVPRYGLEEPVLWRRDRATTIAVKADVAGGVQAPSASRRMDARLDALRAGLPPGYAIVMGGAIEESARGQGSIAKILPLMVLVMVTMLMIQLQSFSRLALVLLTAPLGLIGVTASLLASGLPFGFVALLGVIALAGIIMRNSVILVDQIDADIRAGEPRWTAVVDATVRRARPILLTAAAAILAMIPLAGSVFWGPMAVAIMGGLAGATVLTLFFLPALYAAWFRVRPDEVRAAEPAPAPAPLRALAAE